MLVMTAEYNAVAEDSLGTARIQQTRYQYAPIMAMHIAPDSCLRWPYVSHLHAASASVLPDSAAFGDPQRLQRLATPAFETVEATVTTHPNEKYHPVFKDVSSDWRERWLVLREFIRQWYSTFPFARDHYQIPEDFPAGLHPVEMWSQTVLDVEAKLDVILPPSLREWVSLFDQTNSQYFNLLRDDYAMLWTDNDEVLVIRVLCEGNVAWGVRRCDLHIDDPPVCELDVVSYGAEDSWFGSAWSVSRSVSQGVQPPVTEFIMQQCCHYLSNKTSVVVSLPEDAAQRAKLLERMTSGSERASKFGAYRVFESVNQIAFVHDADKQFTVHFAREPELTKLPDWIRDNSSDHRLK